MNNSMPTSSLDNTCMVVPEFFLGRYPSYMLSHFVHKEQHQGYYFTRLRVLFLIIEYKTYYRRNDGTKQGFAYTIQLCQKKHGIFTDRSIYVPPQDKPTCSISPQIDLKTKNTSQDKDLLLVSPKRSYPNKR